MRIEQDCNGCYFFKKEGSIPPRCSRLGQPLYLIENCLTGPMIQKPKNIDDVIKIGNALIAENRKK